MGKGQLQPKLLLSLAFPTSESCVALFLGLGWKLGVLLPLSI